MTAMRKLALTFAESVEKGAGCMCLKFAIPSADVHIFNPEELLFLRHNATILGFD